MRRYQSEIFEGGKPAGYVYAEEPYTSVHIDGDVELPESYVIRMEGGQRRRISMREQPQEYIRFLSKRINNQKIQVSEPQFVETMLHKAEDVNMSVKALIKNELGQALILRDAYSSYWDLPGGHISNNETIFEGMQREIFEETGLEIVDGKQLFVREIMLGSDFRPTVFYRAYVRDTSKVEISKEHKGFEWIYKKDIPAYNLGVFSDILLKIFDMGENISVGDGDEIHVHITSPSDKLYIWLDEHMRKEYSVPTVELGNAIEGELTNLLARCIIDETPLEVWKEEVIEKYDINVLDLLSRGTMIGSGERLEDNQARELCKSSNHFFYRGLNSLANIVEKDIASVEMEAEDRLPTYRFMLNQLLCKSLAEQVVVGQVHMEEDKEEV